MQVKAPPPIEGLADEDLPDSLRLFLELCQLKQLYRQGWLHSGVARDRCETVAEHSFGVAALAMLLAPTDLDGDRIVRMALIHDFGEIHAGDLTPRDGVPVEEKERRERSSVVEVLGGRPNGAELIALWDEYAAGASPEAQFVREIDRLEMALQALVYENQDDRDRSVFFRSADASVRSADLRGILAAARAVRARNA